MKFILIIFSILNYHAAQSNPSLAELRRLYQNAPMSQDSLKKLSGLLTTFDSSSNIIYLSYKGAAIIMQAKYQTNPLSKFDSFKKGKSILQAAINRDTSQLEARYLRFTIQTNLPFFLNYSANINNDKQFILSNYKNCHDEEFKKMVFHYLSASKFCTAEELNKIKN